MRSTLLGIAILLGSAVLLIGVTVVAARFSDGPITIVPGGPFTSGERALGPEPEPEPDWAFARERREVEFQLIEPPRSRTTWILEHEGKIYIPCGYMTSAWGRIWKQWPIEAMQDGRAILRVDGRLYDRSLVRIENGPQIAPLLAQLSQKYLAGADIGPETVASGSLWLFELAPRSGGERGGGSAS